LTDTAEATDDVKLDSNNPEVPLDFLPKPSPQDYYDDDDFGPMYRFLLNDEFAGSEKDHYRLLLTKAQYFIQNDLLYKFGMPRREKLQRAYPVSERLCLPQQYRGLLLRHFHDKLGHFAVERLFLTLFSTIYWPKNV